MHHGCLVALKEVLGRYKLVQFNDAVMESVEMEALIVRPVELTLGVSTVLSEWPHSAEGAPIS